MKQIPIVLNDFGVYNGDNGEKRIGIATVELPEIVNITSEINVAGVAGKINVPLVGQFEAMQATVTAALPTRVAIANAWEAGEMITCRGALQVYDQVAGKNDMVALAVVMKGTKTSFKLGSMSKGAAMDSGDTYEITYIKVFYDNEALLEIDKYNAKFVVDGKDLMAEVRSMV